MKHNKNISETAYLTAVCRAKNETKSKDFFAKYFIDKKANEFHKLYIRNVSPKEDDLQAIRHQFFLNQLKEFFKENPEGIFINLGAGLSTYPFSLDESTNFIEIDQKNLILEKRRRIEELINKKLLPKRRIEFHTIDFNKKLIKLEIFLSEKMKGKKSFVLMEGLLYYLDKNKIYELLSLLQRLQSQNSILGILTLSEKFENSLIKQRFELFLQKVINQNSNLISISSSYLKKILNKYFCIEETNYFNLSKRLKIGKIKENDDLFWENFYIFKKK